MVEKKTITLDEEAYDTLSEFKTKGKSFSGAVMSMAANICGMSESEDDYEESPKERVSKKLKSKGGKAHSHKQPTDEETEEETTEED